MNQLKAFPAHLLLYVVGAVDLVAQLPALGPLAPYAPYITAAGVLSAALHHAYQTGAASTVAQTVASAPAKLVLAAMALSVVLGASALQGCTTAPTPTAQAGITVAVDIATAAAIQSGAPAESYKARAASFKDIAVKVKAVNDAGTATLATLAADIEPLVAKLPPPDQIAAHVLIAALTPYVNVEIQGNPKLQNTQATLDLILQAVIDSCSAYGA